MSGSVMYVKVDDAAEWDTQLTLDASWSRDEIDVNVLEPWVPELESPAPELAPGLGSDLGFLLPGYSVWEWERFSLPEMAASECARCLQCHNKNATRMPDAREFASMSDLASARQRVSGGRPPKPRSAKTLMAVAAARRAALRGGPRGVPRGARVC